MDDHQPLILGRYGSYVKKLKTQLNAHASRIECEEKKNGSEIGRHENKPERTFSNSVVDSVALENVKNI